VTAALDIEDLTKNFGEFTAVDSLDFKLKPGEIFGLLGPIAENLLPKPVATGRCLLSIQRPVAGS